MMNSQDMLHQAVAYECAEKNATCPHQRENFAHEARSWRMAKEAMDSTENALTAAHARYYELAEELRAHKDNARRLALELGHTLTAAAWIRDNAAQAKNAIAAHDELFK